MCIFCRIIQFFQRHKAINQALRAPHPQPLLMARAIVGHEKSRQCPKCKHLFVGAIAKDIGFAEEKDIKWYRYVCPECAKQASARASE